MEDELYSDLPQFDHSEILRKLQDSNQELQEKVTKLTEQVDSLTIEKEDLKAKCSVLMKNISSAIKTARSEIKRKDARISELNRTVVLLKTRMRLPRNNRWDRHSIERPLGQPKRYDDLSSKLRRGRSKSKSRSYCEIKENESPSRKRHCSSVNEKMVSCEIKPNESKSGKLSDKNEETASSLKPSLGTTSNHHSSHQSEISDYFCSHSSASKDHPKSHESPKPLLVPKLHLPTVYSQRMMRKIYDIPPPQPAENEIGMEKNKGTEMKIDSKEITFSKNDKFDESIKVAKSDLPAENETDMEKNKETEFFLEGSSVNKNDQTSVAEIDSACKVVSTEFKTSYIEKIEQGKCNINLSLMSMAGSNFSSYVNDNTLTRVRNDEVAKPSPHAPMRENDQVSANIVDVISSFNVNDVTGNIPMTELKNIISNLNKMQNSTTADKSIFSASDDSVEDPNVQKPLHDSVHDKESGKTPKEEHLKSSTTHPTTDRKSTEKHLSNVGLKLLNRHTRTTFTPISSQWKHMSAEEGLSLQSKNHDKTLPRVFKSPPHSDINKEGNKDDIMEALFGSPLKWTENSSDEVPPKLCPPLSAFEDSCSAQIENNEFKKLNNTESLSSTKMIKEIIVSKNENDMSTMTIESRISVQKLKDLPRRPFEQVTSQRSETLNFSSCIETVGEVPDVPSSSETLKTLRKSPIFCGKYQDSILGQFDDTTQLIAALAKEHSKISPIRTPIKENKSETGEKESSMKEPSDKNCSSTSPEDSGKGDEVISPSGILSTKPEAPIEISPINESTDITTVVNRPSPFICSNPSQSKNNTSPPTNKVPKRTISIPRKIEKRIILLDEPINILCPRRKSRAENISKIATRKSKIVTDKRNEIKQTAEGNQGNSPPSLNQDSENKNNHLSSESHTHGRKCSEKGIENRSQSGSHGRRSSEKCTENRSQSGSHRRSSEKCLENRDKSGSPRRSSEKGVENRSQSGSHGRSSEKGIVNRSQSGSHRRSSEKCLENRDKSVSPRSSEKGVENRSQSGSHGRSSEKGIVNRSQSGSHRRSSEKCLENRDKSVSPRSSEKGVENRSQSGSHGRSSEKGIVNRSQSGSHRRSSEKCLENRDKSGSQGRSSEKGIENRSPSDFHDNYSRRSPSKWYRENDARRVIENSHHRPSNSYRHYYDERGRKKVSFTTISTKTSIGCRTSRRDSSSCEKETSSYRREYSGRGNSYSKKENVSSRKENSPSRKENSSSRKENSSSRKENSSSRRDNLFSKRENTLSGEESFPRKENSPSEGVRNERNRSPPKPIFKRPFSYERDRPRTNCRFRETSVERRILKETRHRIRRTPVRTIRNRDKDKYSAVVDASHNYSKSVPSPSTQSLNRNNKILSPQEELSSKIAHIVRSSKKIDWTASTTEVVSTPLPEMPPLHGESLMKWVLRPIDFKNKSPGTSDASPNCSKESSPSTNISSPISQSTPVSERNAPCVEEITPQKLPVVVHVRRRRPVKFGVSVSSAECCKNLKES